MIPGEELTLAVGIQEVPVHLNGLGIRHYVEPTDTGEISTTLQVNIDAILDAGGIASINHPTYKWAFDHKAILQSRGASLLEIFNYDRNTHNLSIPLAEELSPVKILDEVLSSGLPLFGVAVDDAHHYHDFSADRYNPGRGWVMVESDSLDQEPIIEALAAGRFYSSTGVSLERLRLSTDQVSLRVRHAGNSIIATQFIGKHGCVLDEQLGDECSYTPKGDEGYVRAWIRTSGGAEAWTQPVFLH